MEHFNFGENMNIAENTVVKLNYTLFDSDGNQLDTTIGKEPFEYIHGTKMIISGLEKQLEGKGPSQKFTAHVPASEAYGLYNENLVLEVSRDQFDTDFPIEVGMAFQATSPNGGALIVHVVKVTDKTVTVDGNHELAGKDLTFDIEILDVREATEEDLKMNSGCCCGGDCGGDCNCGGEGGCGGDCSCGGGCGDCQK